MSTEGECFDVSNDECPEELEESSAERTKDDSQHLSSHSLDCEGLPKESDTNDTIILSQLPKLPVNAKQSSRVKLYGRAPNPSMTLNEIEYVLQRRRRPRYRTDLLYEDTFVVARIRKFNGSDDCTNIIARVPTKLSVPVLNESFDIDTYMSSTYVDLEVFDIKQHSSDNTVLGRMLLYPRSRHITVPLSDIIGFAEVFRPKSGDIVVHGIIPGAHACLELACTEAFPSRIIPSKMWRRAKLSVTKSTLGLSMFPFAPLFLITTDVLEKSCSDKVENIGEIYEWADTSRAILLSLTSLPPFPNSTIDIVQRLHIASLAGAGAVCQLLDDFWEHCRKAPAVLSDISLDIFPALLRAFIRQETPIDDVLEQIRTMFSWYVRFSSNIDAVESNKIFTKYIGRLFIKKVSSHTVSFKTINVPTLSHACALEPSISNELITAIYHLELELFKNQSPSSEPDYTPNPLNHVQGVYQLLNPVFKVWLQSFDDAVGVGNYEYVHLLISKGKTKECNLFAPLGLISLSKTLVFSAIDFEVTPKMILETPSTLSRYINTTPLDWVMLSHNGDILNEFLSTCLAHDRSSVDFIQKTYSFAVSWGIKSLSDIPQQLLPSLTRDHAIAIIMGSMVHGDAEQLSALLDFLQTCTFEPTTESSMQFKVFYTTTLFINMSLSLDDTTACTFSIPESLRSVIERLFSPTIYLFFSAKDRVSLLSAVIASNIDQDFIIELLKTLSSRSAVLHCSESECLLQHALDSGKLSVVAWLLYNFFVDPTKHMDLWMRALCNYNDDVIIHLIDSLLLRATLAECDSAIAAFYENTYTGLIRQHRFDSLRIINSHIQELMSSGPFSNYKRIKSIDEDIIRLYLFATMAPSGKIMVSERMIDDILTLVNIFGPRSLASVDVLFQRGSLGLDELLEDSIGPDFNLSPDQLSNIFTSILNRVTSLLPGLLTVFLKFIDYALSPLTDKEVKDDVKRPSLDFLTRPNCLITYLLAGENSITLMYEQLERQLQSAGLTWADISTTLMGEISDKKDHRAYSGVTCLAILQSILKAAICHYHTRIDKAQEFAKIACLQLTSSNQSTMVTCLEFLLIQRAIMQIFTKSQDIFNLDFMSAPDVLSNTTFCCPFSMSMLASINICVSECAQLTRLGAYSIHLVPKEILQQILQVKGIYKLCHTPISSTNYISDDTNIMNIPVIQSYYRFLNALNSNESSPSTPLSITPKQSVSEQIDSLTETYKCSNADRTVKSKDDFSPIIFSMQFVDNDLLSSPKKTPAFRGDTILHTIFSLFDFDESAEVTELIASILADTLTTILEQCQVDIFSQINASYKTPLQMISATSLDHVLLVLNIIKKVNTTLLSPHNDALADYPSLIHYFLFNLITNSSEHILSQILPLVPQTVMRDFLLAPCPSLSNSILLTALLQRGLGDLEYLIDIYKQYGCLNEAAVMPDSGGWCAVTVALQNHDIVEVPNALVEAAMKSPKELIINKYGQTPLHCLFFNKSLVSQTPHKDEGKYVYSYHVLSDNKTDPVFKLSAAQRLIGADELNDSLSQLDRFGMTPLHYAVISSAFVCMESLLSKHTPVQLLDKAGLDRDVTPLELALARKSEQMVQLLLQKGASPLRRTSMISFLGEPLTVFARLIQNGYLNLAYTVIYQHSSMKSLLLNEALHANTLNSKPVLRALIDGTVETSAPYLALSISGKSIDQQLMQTIIDSLQYLCATSAKKIHITNWLGTIALASPTYWFGDSNSIYSLFVKIANATNFAESNLTFNLRMITSSISVKLLRSGLRIRGLVSTLKADTTLDDSVFIEKASPVELMLLKLYYSFVPSIFVEKEFLMLFQLYVCKSLHISSILSRIVLDFLTATQTETITKANIQFCSQFFNYLNAMLVADECLVPNLAVKSLRMHTKEFIVKLLGTDEILSTLFTVLALPPPSACAPSKGPQIMVIGKSGTIGNNFMQDYIPCCLNILKCYVATNSVTWPLFFSTIYGVHSEIHKNPKMVVDHVFNQLNSVDQVSKPSIEILLSAATTSLASLYNKGCTESVICNYLTDLLDAAKQQNLYDTILAQIFNQAQTIKDSSSTEESELCGIFVDDLDTKFTDNVAYIKELLDASVNRTIQPTGIRIPSIVLGPSQEPYKLVDQVFHNIPSQKSSVFYQDGSSLRVDGYCCHFMLINTIPRMNGMLLAFHSYSLKFKQSTDSYVIVYKSGRTVAELKSGCYSWHGIPAYWPEKELYKYNTVDQAIKSFYTYFKKKSGLNFIDCCSHGLPQTYYETAADRKGIVCYVGKDVVGLTTEFLEVTPTMEDTIPDVFLYSIVSNIADKIDSTIVPKLHTSESKDWRALKLLSSVVLSALSFSLSPNEACSYGDPGFCYTVVILKRALSVYETIILPILDSPGFVKLIKAMESYSDPSEIPAELILNAFGMAVYMHESSGLPMYLLPLFVLCSRLSLHYLKMHIANIKLALEGVHRGSMLLLASLCGFEESQLNVKVATTLVDRVLGVKLRVLDKQTSFVLQTLNNLPKRTVICRILEWRKSDVVIDVMNQTKEFVALLSKGRNQCQESWINRRTNSQNVESKSKIDWSGANLLWNTCNQSTSALIPLLSGSLAPSKYDQWSPHHYNFNFNTTPLYGVSVTSILQNNEHLKFGVILNNMFDFFSLPQPLNSGAMKVAPGVFYSQGNERSIQKYVAAGFKYNHVDNCVYAISFTPEAMYIQYVACL